MKRYSLGELFAIFLVTGSLAASLHATVALAPLFADGAVLQRDKPVPVWGTADAGEKVSVSFGGQTHASAAGPDGHWRVELTALPASATPREIVVIGTNTLTVRDVVVGEVWLASGQSNMEWPLAYSADAKTEIAAANFPLVRQFKVAKQPSFTPLATANGAWSPALPGTAGQFSGVAYYFALELHRQLNVPVGILNSSWGGTGIDVWISPDAYRTTPSLAATFRKHEQGPRATAAEKADFDRLHADWEKARNDAKAAGQPFNEPAPKAPPGLASYRTLTALYNGMIHPLVPYALRGAIWYQGESNTSSANAYPSRMVALIGGWRKAFNQGDFPFYWVQLPNFNFGGVNQTNWLWAEMREAQTKSLEIPHTGQAITIDVGEEKGLHPKNKKPVGERLARLALARDYGVKDVIDSGPVFKAAIKEGRAYRITYQPSPAAVQALPAGLTGFELAGADQVFHPAQAVIEEDTVVVTSPIVPDPVAVRYAYRNAPAAGLFNVAGLPAAPFRTDNWPASKAAKPAPGDPAN